MNENERRLTNEEIIDNLDVLTNPVFDYFFGDLIELPDKVLHQNEK